MQESVFVEKIKAEGGRVFLVGGWVRDCIRGTAAKDKDYVISGFSEDRFKELFPEAKKVGRSFPVYLVSIDGKSAEVAFARRERKTGSGYTGFAVESQPGVRIEEDLWRRDTTMNSMALELPEKQLLDPFGGRQDIRAGRIRAVSRHFMEDPVRALRAARQAAELGFSITQETLDYMRACRGELCAEPQERIVHEMERALAAPRPSIFFFSLQKAGLLQAIFPELYALIGKTQPVEFHPEGDAFLHTMKLLDEVSASTTTIAARFAGLAHDLGKGTTPDAMLPHHYAHEIRGGKVLEAWNARSTLPKLWLQCASFIIREHMRAPRLVKPAKIVALLLQVYKSSLNFSDFNAIIRADHGSLPDYLMHGEAYLQAILEVSGRGCPDNLKGREIGDWLTAARVRAYSMAAAEKTKL